MLITPSLGLHLRAPEFCYGMLHRLGAAIFQEEGPCIQCGIRSDKYGDHAISCGMSGERISRHNQLRDALFSAASSANLAPLREMRALIPESDSRPADILIPRYTNGLDTCIDVTVINSCRLDLLLKSAEEPGHALNHIHKAKWSKHGAACERAGMVFLPLAIDTFGAIHAEGAQFLKKLGK